MSWNSVVSYLQAQLDLRQKADSEVSGHVGRRRYQKDARSLIIYKFLIIGQSFLMVLGVVLKFFKPSGSSKKDQCRFCKVSGDPSFNIVMEVSHIVARPLLAF